MYLSHLCIVRFDWRVFSQVGVCILIVYIVADANKFLPPIGACDQNDGHANCIALRDQSCIWSIRLSIQ